MPGILLSGPAGGGKSQLSRDLIREATEPAIQADFQSIVVALLGLVRLPTACIRSVQTSFSLWPSSSGFRPSPALRHGKFSRSSPTATATPCGALRCFSGLERTQPNESLIRAKR